MPETLTNTELSAIVSQEIAGSLAYDKSSLSEKRRLAIEYQRGELTDWPAEKGRSSVTSRDTSDTISWILPGIIRLFTASGQIAICEPVEPGDERWAKQATTGINHAFWKDNDGYRILYDATYDSLLHSAGIVKHWWDTTPEVKTSFHSGLTEDALAALLTPEYSADDEDGPEETIELLKQKQKIMVQPGYMGPDGQPIPDQEISLYDVKIKRTKRCGRIRMACIAPEDFLISAEAITIRGARMHGMKEQKTRSDLIEMGFDAETVNGLAREQSDDPTDQARREFERFDTAATEAMEEVTLYELYLKIDVDNDGIAEMVQVFYAGETVLSWDVWEDEPMFSDIPCEPIPHRWEGDGGSVFDKTRDIQEIKTVLTREGLNNMYASNNPQRFVTGRILNPDEFANPSFGGTVFAEQGATVTPLTLPFVAETALTGIEFFNNVLEKRTGVSRQSMALDPEALQNQTATAAQLAHDASYSQTELIARNQAEYSGWREVFRNVLKLMVRHQDQPRMIRLDGVSAEAPIEERWMKIDPRHWNADMDITINTGLGTGSRDRDMAMLRSVLNDQVLLAQSYEKAGMVDKAVGMIPMMETTMRRSAEAAGIRSPEMFYPQTSAEDVQKAVQGIAANAQKGSPEERIAQAEMQAKAQTDQMQAQMDAQLEAAKVQAQSQIEAAQAQADLIVEDNKRKTEEYLAGVEARFKAMSDNQQRMFEASEKQKDRDHEWRIANLNNQAKVDAAKAKPKPNGREGAPQ